MAGLERGVRPIGTLVDVDDLVDPVEAFDAGVRAGNDPGAIEMPGERLVEDIGDERGLARAGDAGDRHEKAERQVDREVLEVVGGSADDAEPVPWRRLAPAAGNRHPQLTPEVAAGERVGVAEDVVDGSLGDDLAAESARARTEVDDVVGGLDGFGVVLDDDDRVAEIAKPSQRAEQPLVVPLVQPDAWLVEDVEHADQPRPDLGGEPDALRLAAGERVGRPSQREIARARHRAESAAGQPLP